MRALIFSGLGFFAIGAVLGTVAAGAHGLIREARPDMPQPPVEAGQPLTSPGPLVGNAGGARESVEAAAGAPLTHDHELEEKLAAAQEQVAALEIELASCRATQTAVGLVAEWYGTLRPEERPDQRTLALMAEWLHDYPVHLSPDEGLEIARWINDPSEPWRGLGPTIDEALETFLGPERIARETVRH